jgi:hypothetical protein
MVRMAIDAEVRGTVHPEIPDQMGHSSVRGIGGHWLTAGCSSRLTRAALAELCADDMCSGFKRINTITHDLKHRQQRDRE